MDDFERLEMIIENYGTVRRRVSALHVLIGITLMLCAGVAGAQTQPAEARSADSRSAEAKPAPSTYETIFLAYATRDNDMNDIQTDLRNLLPKVKVYGLPSQHAISLWAAPEDMALARKIVSDLDRAKRVYRLTYTIADLDNGKRAGVEHYVLIVSSGEKSDFKQGNRVPVITGSYDTGTTTSNSQVQYVDVGLGIEATLDGYGDGVRVRSKISQSSVADEKSGIGTQDPMIRQTQLEATTTLEPGKPVVLGSLDLPGGTRKQEIEVVSELVR
jgi:type II secretory pathway component GspD/PulD (secretin)